MLCCCILWYLVGGVVCGVCVGGVVVDWDGCVVGCVDWDWVVGCDWVVGG